MDDEGMAENYSGPPKLLTSLSAIERSFSRAPGSAKIGSSPNSRVCSQERRAPLSSCRANRSKTATLGSTSHGAAPRIRAIDALSSENEIPVSGASRENT